MSRHSKEFTNFSKLTHRLLAVPHDVIQKRIDRKREQAAQNPHKRGPKPKVSGPSVSGREGA
jgi:hypothetical protein